MANRNVGRERSGTLSRLLAGTCAGVLLACATTAPAAEALAVPAPPAWVQESNKAAQPLLDAIAEYNPEQAAQLGVDGYDDKIIDLQPKLYERSQATLQKVIDGLNAQLPQAADPALKQDLEIMIGAAQRQFDSAKLQNDLMLP